MFQTTSVLLDAHGGHEFNLKHNFFVSSFFETDVVIFCEGDKFRQLIWPLGNFIPLFSEKWETNLKSFFQKGYKLWFVFAGSPL